MKFTIIVSILIIIAVLLPGSSIPEVGVVGFDKVVHFGMFATWAIAVRYDFQSKYKFLFAFVAGISFSLLTEILQILVEGRTFDLYDVLADVTGLLFGLLISKFLLSLIARVKS
jgi:VanZ family protein